MRRIAQKTLAYAMDAAMCGMMNTLQWRRRDTICSREEFEDYLGRCAILSREEFYQVPKARIVSQGEWYEWDSPHPSGFAENDRPRFRMFLSPQGRSAPTVLLLHALMSASDGGYQRLAKWFNARGWNAVFPHLPFHYSRTPKGYFNGELAITADLIRNGETLRQGVVELRQIMAFLREGGCREFGLVGTSFGGWNGALLSFVEADFRFITLIQPIVNIEHAIWRNPASIAIRRLLAGQGIESGQSERHAHLSSPMHGTPLCDPSRVIVCAGQWDTVSPAAELDQLVLRWPGARLITVPQGHFGYAALRESRKQIEPYLGNGDFTP